MFVEVRELMYGLYLSLLFLDLSGATYGRSPKVGNPIASILKCNVYGIPALFGLSPVSNFLGFTIMFRGVYRALNC